MNKNISDHPILFNGQMINAILSGKKTQTRRLLKPQPMVDYGDALSTFHGHELRCPYGESGDRLWVRETFSLARRHDPFSPSQVGNGDDGIWWRADGSSLRPLGSRQGKTRSSIHMPMWASRIRLSVVNIWIEQLQDITPAEAIDEGVECVESAWAGMSTALGLHGPRKFVMAFENLWNSINAKRGHPWESNPWVWVVEFEIDHVAAKTT